MNPWVTLALATLAGLSVHWAGETARGEERLALVYYMERNNYDWADIEGGVHLKQYREARK